MTASWVQLIDAAGAGVGIAAAALLWSMPVDAERGTVHTEIGGSDLAQSGGPRAVQGAVCQSQDKAPAGSHSASCLHTPPVRHR